MTLCSRFAKNIRRQREPTPRGVEGKDYPVSAVRLVLGGTSHSRLTSILDKKTKRKVSLTFYLSVS